MKFRSHSFDASMHYALQDFFLATKLKAYSSYYVQQSPHH
ncbi:hypothetical protein L512_3032 [Bordetella bronchiseptica MBORD624]|nr:hypothetical protein L512_3032 [Bordetella bronchiseptica MBORD624]